MEKAVRVTKTGLFANLTLFVFKLAAGILGHSTAMIADAVHTLSDLGTDIVVLASFRIASKPADESHDYGHGKYETFATAVIGLALFLAGTGILWSGAKKIGVSLFGLYPERPGIIALAAAAISFVTKETLYRYTARVAKDINSQAVIANAWHHRSDALSSIGTMLGIGGAFFLGEKWHAMDPLAAVVISFFIMKIAATIFMGSMRELTEESLNEAVEKEIMAIAGDIDGTIGPHDLKTRRIGNAISIDLHLYVDKDLNVVDSHEIASNVESALRARFGEKTFVSVHIEPHLTTQTQSTNSD